MKTPKSVKFCQKVINAAAKNNLSCFVLVIDVTGKSTGILSTDLREVEETPVAIDAVLNGIRSLSSVGLKRMHKIQ